MLANIPTGGGKTIVATAVQRILGGTSLFLTHTKQLQAQYRGTATWAEVAMGKNNYACGRDPGDALRLLFENGLTADECDDFAGCLDRSRATPCEYVRMLYRAADNPQVVMNYAYAVRLLQAGSLKKSLPEHASSLAEPAYNPFRRDLLVADEGHLLEQALIDATTITVRKRGCDEARAGWLLPEASLSMAVEWAQQALPVVERYVELLASQAQAEKTEGLLRRLRRARALHEALGDLGGADPEEWALLHEGDVVKVRPVWGWAVRGALFYHFPRVLIMSATMPKTLPARLGIPADQTVVIDRPSIFPVENRPVFYWPIMKVNRHTDDAEWASLASAIRFISEQGALKGRKGLVHTASFKVARALEPHLRGGRFVCHTRSDLRDALMQAFTTSNEPMVLVTPSFTTGFDYSGIGWQVIAKVPFGDLGDPITKLRHEYALDDDPKFGRKVYDDEAMNTVVQAAGRAVRSPADQGVTYILDSSYWPLHKRAYMPHFYEQAVKWLR